MPQIKDFLAILAKIAPTMAGLAGGPLAATAVAEAERVLGIIPTPSASITERQDAVAAALSAGATPQQIIDLKKADDELKQKFIDAGVQLYSLDEKDRESARQLGAQTKDPTPRILTYLIASACGAVAGIIIGGFSPSFKDPTTAATVGTIVGYLFGELKAATAYWFGTSSGSEQKNALISKALGQ